MMKRVEVKGFGQKCEKFWSTRLLRVKKEKAIYQTVIRSIVIYGSEVWALSRSDENTLKNVGKENSEKNICATIRKWPPECIPTLT
jgi:hypothetical protein